ncbi:MAG: hypothetical protein V7784_20870 [Oceanospirillaceae bacterium]
MKMTESLNSADNFMDTIDEKMNGLVLAGALKSKVFNALLHVSLEHFGSISVLISRELNGSAAAL